MSLSRDSRADDRMAALEPKDATLAAVQGVVVVNLRPGALCTFDPNRAMYENPRALLSVSPQGIEAIKIHFVSMDPKEDNLCDQLSQNLSHLNQLKVLKAKNSDFSDAALFKIDSLPALYFLDLSGSMVSRKCLKAAARFKNLQSLGLSNLHFNGADFGAWATLAKLDAVLVKLKSLKKLTRFRPWWHSSAP